MDDEELERRIVAYMTRSRSEGALWTYQVAKGVGMLTPSVRTALSRLEQQGIVRRVADGASATSWALTLP